MGFEFQHLIVSIATSFIGSYITIRSISILFGGFPNELDLSQRLQTGVYSGMPWYVYLYLGLILILFVLGLFVQTKVQNQDLNTIVNNEKIVGLLEHTEKQMS